MACRDAVSSSWLAARVPQRARHVEGAFTGKLAGDYSALRLALGCAEICCRNGETIPTLGNRRVPAALAMDARRIESLVTVVTSTLIAMRYFIAVDDAVDHLFCRAAYCCVVIADL